MRINHNIPALNTYRQMGANANAASKNMEKLSSGLKINRAGDDAAGLAISEKMRGQIRGLDMAGKNAQDGISMIQTAEGALNETHSILQRMRELSVQSANDTNTDTDRTEIQKEVNQLTSEINRIGNTTEFNTKSLLKGEGNTAVGLDKTGATIGTITQGTATKTQASATITAGTVSKAGDTYKLTIGGKEFSHTVSAAGLDATATGAELETALKAFIDKDETLKGQFDVSSATGKVTIEAKANGTFAGDKGVISQATAFEANGTTAITGAAATAGVGITTQNAATGSINLGGVVKGNAGATLVDKDATTAAIKDLIGKGLEINGQKIEFYNVNDGAYKGDGLGVDISKALDAVTAASGTTADKAANTTSIQNALTKAIADQIGDKVEGVSIKAGAAGVLDITTTAKGTDAKLEIKDGSVPPAMKDFEATFQVGANKGQSMTITIADMRSDALGLTGKAGSEGFSKENNVTDGTSAKNAEAALNVTDGKSASAAIETINKAIENVSAQRSNLGSFQNRLEHTINNLGTSAENLTAAESRIRDVDMAKEMMDMTKNNILNQAAQAMLAQANQAPQAVLQLLR